MPATVYDAIIGALSVRQVRSTNFTANADVIHAFMSGAVSASEIYGGKAEPKFTLESMDIAGVLGSIDVLTGLAVAAGTITVPFNARQSGGSFQSGSNHPTLSATHALAVIMELSAKQDDEGATVSIDVAPYSTSGLTSPVAANVNQSLAAQAFNAQYAMGPGSINGSSLDGLQGITVNTGLEVRLRRNGGGIFPDDVYIVKSMPYIDFEFEDLDALNTHAPTFKAMTAAIAYFRKRSGASFVADGTAQHCKFSFADGIVSAQDLSGQEQNEAQATMRCWGEALTATATSAIT